MGSLLGSLGSLVGLSSPTQLASDSNAFAGTRTAAMLQQAGQPLETMGTGANQATLQNNQANAIVGLRGNPVQASPQPATTGPYDTTTTGGTGTTGGTAAADNSYWNQQNGLLDNQLNQLGGQQATGNQNILDAYNSAFNTLTNQQNQDQRDYNTSRNNVVQNNLLTDNQIGQGVQHQNTSLQRLLGSVGAGNSSAAQILAPYAAALQGSQQRNAATRTYDQNLGALDTNFGDTQNQFNNSFGNLATQRDAQTRALQSGVDTTKQNLLNEKAQLAAYYGQPVDPSIGQQVADLGNQVNALGVTPTFTPNLVNYTAPNLAQYNVTNAPAPNLTNTVDPNAAATVGPYWTLLNGQQQKQPLAGAATS